MVSLWKMQPYVYVIQADITLRLPSYRPLGAFQMILHQQILSVHTSKYSVLCSPPSNSMLYNGSTSVTNEIRIIYSSSSHLLLSMQQKSADYLVLKYSRWTSGGCCRVGDSTCVCRWSVAILPYAPQASTTAITNRACCCKFYPRGTGSRGSGTFTSIPGSKC